MPAKAPMMDTGTARSGMKVARQFCRNTKTTTTTRTMASMKVVITASIEALMKRVVLNGTS